MISAVVCHHKGEMVNEAVKSLHKSVGVDLEVIVVTSVDEFVCPYADRTVFCKGGPATKRNYALRFSIGDYIAFFDDDVVVDKDTVLELYKVIRNKHRVGMVFGKLIRMDDAITFDEAGSFLTWNGFLWARGDNVKDEGQFEKIVPVLAGKSASCMIKRKVFGHVGLFDPSYGILGEESDLAWRVWIAGYRVLYVPKSVTLHAFNTRFKPQDFYTKRRVYFNGCRNYISMLSTNLEFWNAIRIIPIHVSMWFSCAIGMLFKFRFEEASLIFKGIVYNLINIKFIIEKRRKVNSIRCRKDKVIFKHVMRNPSLGYYGSRFFRYLKGGVHG